MTTTPKVADPGRATALWSARVASVLELQLLHGVSDGVFPGAVGCVGALSSPPEAWPIATAGKLQPGGAVVQENTPYDLASLTKPVVAMTALKLVQAGALRLEDQLERWIPELARTQIGASEIRQLLNHRSGLAAWAPLFEQQPHRADPRAAMHWVVEQLPKFQSTAPGVETCYSDLGYIVLGEVLTRAGARPLEDLVLTAVLEPLGLEKDLVYASRLPAMAQAALVSRSAPTENCSWRGRLLRGEVHDENCASLGGVTGHAGLFGTARAVATFAIEVLRSCNTEEGYWPRELARLALPPEQLGAYGLGWDQGGRGASAAGRFVGARAFGHLGFTGTSVFIDPDACRAFVLLSNRVHPTRENVRIRQFRPKFHDAVAESAGSSAMREER